MSRPNGAVEENFVLFFRPALGFASLERVSGVEPPSLNWQSSIITAILHPHLVPESGVEPESTVFQTAALTTLGTPAFLWALRDSDPRPSRCKRDALSHCAKCPYIKVSGEGFEPSRENFPLEPQSKLATNYSTRPLFISFNFFFSF